MAANTKPNTPIAPYVCPREAQGGPAAIQVSAEGLHIEDVEIGVGQGDLVANRAQGVRSGIRADQNGDASGWWAGKIARRQRQINYGLAESLHILQVADDANHLVLASAKPQKQSVAPPFVLQGFRDGFPLRPKIP
jgi:hypothetical protein